MPDPILFSPFPLPDSPQTANKKGFSPRADFSYLIMIFALLGFNLLHYDFFPSVDNGNSVVIYTYFVEGISTIKTTVMKGEVMCKIYLKQVKIG